MNTDLDKKGYYKKPVIVGKCPLCGSPVETIRPYGHEYCTKDSCPYDTSQPRRNNPLQENNDERGIRI